MTRRAIALLAGTCLVVGPGLAQEGAPHEEPATEEPAAEDPAAEDPAAEEHAAEDPPAEDPPPPEEEAAPFDDAPFSVDDEGWIDLEDETWEEVELQEEVELDFHTTIIGKKGDRDRVAGSAHVVDEEQLERYEYDDIHRVMKQVPGVYVREEDGFGLRPNIGLRGANSDRSAKVTLLEDGVLLGPAPYSAPAAYYFPLTTRMVGVEVFKGPASVKHGPNTVGGAVNLVTRKIPYGLKAGIDAGLGAYMTGKAHGFLGYGTEYFGFLIEGVRLQTGGFKQLDGGGDTGFWRDDLMLKARVNNRLDSVWTHALELKAGYQDEDSRETYLGLSDEDFDRAPYRRYAASQLGHMAWRRLQLQASYKTTWSDWLDATVTAYRHDFHRAWTKLNNFADPSLDVSNVLRFPSTPRNQLFYDILRGNVDSADASQALLIGTNDRTFVSQGVQAVAHVDFELFTVRSKTEVGARFHQDQIDRLHTEDPYLMKGRRLVRVPEAPTDVTADNHGDAYALAAWVHEELSWRGLLVAPGLRFEGIRTGFINELSGDVTSGLQWALLPGVGVSWQPFDWVSGFAGLHRGFSPVAPGQPQEVSPEDSWNVEAGARLETTETRAELIGYFNRYSNLVGNCTFSAGCDDQLVGAQYNGGEVWVYGVEALFGHRVALPWGIELRGDLVYTLTLSQFQHDFTSQSPQFGVVEAGDALSYVPVHQGALMLTASGRGFDFGLTGSYLGAMRDLPGQGAIRAGEGTDPLLILDATASYQVTGSAQLYFKADNLLNQAGVASRRPYGARPSKPMSFFVGIKYALGD